VQKRPPAEIELKPICDPVTGLPIRNPFSTPPDLTSQMLLEKENPELAKYYRDTKDGTTFAMVAKIKAEREARDKIRGIVYGQKEHAQNPFLLSGKEGLKAQSEFVRGNEHQPHLVNWYQHEAKATPTLDFNNLTTRQLVSKRSPIVGAIFEKARQLHAHFLREDQARLEAEVAERQGQLQATQRQLASAR